MNLVFREDSSLHIRDMNWFRNRWQFRFLFIFSSSSFACVDNLLRCLRVKCSMTNSSDQKFKSQREHTVPKSKVWSDTFACDSIYIYILFENFLHFFQTSHIIETTLTYIHLFPSFFAWTSCDGINKSWVKVTWMDSNLFSIFHFVSFRFDLFGLQLKILINFRMSKLHWIDFTFPFLHFWIQCVWLMITSSNLTQLKHTAHTVARTSEHDIHSLSAMTEHMLQQMRTFSCAFLCTKAMNCNQWKWKKMQSTRATIFAKQTKTQTQSLFNLPTTNYRSQQPNWLHFLFHFIPASCTCSHIAVECCILIPICYALHTAYGKLLFADSFCRQTELWYHKNRERCIKSHNDPTTHARSFFLAEIVCG